MAILYCKIKLYKEVDIIKKSKNSQMSEIDLEILNLEKQLKNQPQGKLILTHNEGRAKWYVREGGKTIYLPKRYRDKAEKLAYKKYLEAKILFLKKKRKKISGDNNDYKEANDKYYRLLSDSHFIELLKPYHIVEDMKDDWAKEKYITNNNHPENKTHSTVNGIKVRSKSESIIAMVLANNGIPFRYECLLDLSGWNVFPDFTLRHPKSEKIIYWEHLGMMDDDEYVTNVRRKLNKYVSEGIYPMDNLILTYETAEKPLDYEYVDKIVKMFLL